MTTARSAPAPRARDRGRGRSPGSRSGSWSTRLDTFSDAIREVTLPLRHDDIIRQQAAEKDVDPPT